jgi:hypothetical protein
VEGESTLTAAYPDAGASTATATPDAGGALVVVAPRPPARHNLKPPPPPADSAAAPQVGMLDVNCVPWCHIYLDGTDTGLESPAPGIQLPAGRHRLRVVNPPTGLQRELEVDVAPGKSQRTVIRF